MLSHEVTPPRVARELSATKIEDRVQVQRQPAGLMPPILEERLAGAEEALRDLGV
jgi:hypothetical protein